MKIQYKVVGAVTDWITLMDVANGDTVEPWEPDYNARHNVQELASNSGQGKSVFTDTLGNIRCELPLHSMCVTYASLAAALAASRTVPTVFLGSLVHFKVTEGTEVQYFPYAVCHHCKPSVQGASVVFNMDFTTKMVTDQEPS